MQRDGGHECLVEALLLSNGVRKRSLLHVVGGEVRAVRSRVIITTVIAV